MQAHLWAMNYERNLREKECQEIFHDLPLYRDAEKCIGWQNASKEINPFGYVK